MTTKLSPRFKDEWLIKIFANIPAITPQFIDDCRRQGKPYLGQAVVEANAATNDELDGALRDVYNIGFLSPQKDAIDKLALSLVPEKICRNHLLMPVRLVDGSIEVAMANPLDTDACADVQAVSGRTPVPYYCPPEQVEGLINEIFSSDLVVFDLLERLDEPKDVELLSHNPAVLEKHDDVPTPSYGWSTRSYPRTWNFALRTSTLSMTYGRALSASG